jgi:hypothetical protein
MIDSADFRDLAALRGSLMARALVQPQTAESRYFLARMATLQCQIGLELSPEQP